MTFPMHSPLVTKIEVLRRGYIGRNKNAYFLRAMLGRRNQIPLDKERQALDELYASLIEGGRQDEIPESDYPKQEWDRYPLPSWKQDADDWDEEKYDPKQEWDRYPLPSWKQDADDWDEAKYNPKQEWDRYPLPSWKQDADDW